MQKGQSQVKWFDPSPASIDYVNPEKKRLIMNALLLPQFGYFFLTWMFHDRELNHKIKRLHERCLRVVCHDATSAF